MRWSAAVPYLAFGAIWLILYLTLIGVLPAIWKRTRRLGAASYPRIVQWTRLGPVFERHEKRITAWRAYLPPVLIFAGGLVVTAWLAEDFYDIAEKMKTQDTLLQRVDQTASDLAFMSRSSAVTPFFTLFTLIGSPVGLAVLVFIVTVGLVIRKSRARIAYLLVTSIGGSLLNLWLKDHFERARPDLEVALRKAHGYSFPSGHSMGATIVFGALAYVVWKSHYRWRITSALIALLVTSTITVALSRVYLGVHWISDIGAGVMAGIVWLTIMTVGFELTLRLRDLRRGRQLPENV